MTMKEVLKGKSNEDEKEVKSKKEDKKEEFKFSEPEQLNDEKLDDIKKDISESTAVIQTDFDNYLSDAVETSCVEDIVKLSTGLDVLDAISGGGFPLGNFSVIVGKPGGGKTTLAVNAMRSLQTNYKGRCLSVFLDSEETMSTYRLSELGVNDPKIDPKSGLTIEKVFEILEGICLFKETKNLIDLPTVVVWDSIANTITNKDLTATDPNEVIGLKARILSMMLPKYVTKLRKYNISLIAINQLRDKINMGIFTPAADLKYMGQEQDMPGGQAIKFNASQLFHVRHKSDLKEEQFGFRGAKVALKTIKNKFFTPNIEIDLVLDFKKGFNNFWTNYIFLSDNKKIKTGAWNKIEGYEGSFRTKEAEELYKTDPKFKELYDNLVKETIQEVIIEKYS